MKKLVKCLSVICAIATISTTIYANNVDEVIVKQDDTLWKISCRYGVHLDDVINANPHFNNPDLIYPGDVVYVPLDGSENGNQNDNTEKEIGASMTDDGSGKVDTKNAKPGAYSNVTSQTSSNAYESKVAQLVNQERAKQKLAPLTLSADISNVARIKSEDMRNNKYFSHNSPKYGSPFQMLKEFGIKYRTAGENIAKGQKTPEAVMKAWMNSAGHRKNIMNPNYKEIGVGYVTDSSGTTYWTQQFVTR